MRVVEEDAPLHRNFVISTKTPQDEWEGAFSNDQLCKPVEVTYQVPPWGGEKVFDTKKFQCGEYTLVWKNPLTYNYCPFRSKTMELCHVNVYKTASYASKNPPLVNWIRYPRKWSNMQSWVDCWDREGVDDNDWWMGMEDVPYVGEIDGEVILLSKRVFLRPHDKIWDLHQKGQLPW